MTTSKINNTANTADNLEEIKITPIWTSEYKRLDFVDENFREQLEQAKENGNPKEITAARERLAKFRFYCKAWLKHCPAIVTFDTAQKFLSEYLKREVIIVDAPNEDNKHEKLSDFAFFLYPDGKNGIVSCANTAAVDARKKDKTRYVVTDNDRIKVAKKGIDFVEDKGCTYTFRPFVVNDTTENIAADTKSNDKKSADTNRDKVFDTDNSCLDFVISRALVDSGNALKKILANEEKINALFDSVMTETAEEMKLQFPESTLEELKKIASDRIINNLVEYNKVTSPDNQSDSAADNGTGENNQSALRHHIDGNESEKLPADTDEDSEVGEDDDDDDDSEVDELTARGYVQDVDEVGFENLADIVNGRIGCSLNNFYLILRCLGIDAQKDSVFARYIDEEILAESIENEIDDDDYDDDSAAVMLYNVLADATDIGVVEFIYLCRRLGFNPDTVYINDNDDLAD